MNRRESVKIISRVSVGYFALPLTGALFGSCQSTFSSGLDKDFTSDEKALIGQLSDAILPDTNTPGALKAGVPAYIILMLQDCYDGSTRKVFHQGLAGFNTRCRQKYQSSFLGLSKERQTAAVKELDSAVLSSQSQDDLFSFYSLFKQLTVTGFFSAETGATKTLRYLPVPGHYDGCVSYHKGDKAWAT